jgi:EF-hand domain
LEEAYSRAVKEQLEIPYYQSIRRFAGKAFRRALLGEKVDLSQWSMDDLFSMFDVDNNGSISRAELRDGLLRHFHINLTRLQLESCFPLSGDGSVIIDRASFVNGIMQVLRTK